MNARLFLISLSVAPLTALAQPATPSEPENEPATKVYRQQLPDGRIIYSDEPLPGAQVERTLTVDPSPEAEPWSVPGSENPPAERRPSRTPVERVPDVPEGGRAKTADEARAQVIRAEMLLENARRELAGAAPLAGEDSAGYARRRAALARAVQEAEQTLQQAILEQKALSQ